jgi:hypothetical protein
MIGLFTHATGCFVRDSVDPDYISTFPFYSTDHCLGYFSWRFIIWPFIIYFGERVWREIRARRATRLSKVLVHPSGMLLLYITPRRKLMLSASVFAYRCYGAPDHQAQLQVYSWSMALCADPRALQVPMAPRKWLYLTNHQSASHLRISSPLPLHPKIHMSPSTSVKLVTGLRLLASVLAWDLPL